MRDYQLAGLNWLIRLYENGINGILADEMVSIEFCLLGLALSFLPRVGLGIYVLFSSCNVPLSFCF